ncbi:MAG: winged helix-turn-helix domain-containing tetratricopeptide repeat protein [Paracoccaceae bacterium]
MAKIVIGSRLFDAKSCELLDGKGVPIPLRNQSLKVLAFLVRHAGLVVSPEQIKEEVWRETTVTDDSLVQCISDIRRALGSEDKSRLETLKKRGYRLLVDNDEMDCQLSVENGRHLFLQLDLPASLAERPSIAVLPFANISGEQGKEDLIDGLSEDIITALSRIKWFFVIASTSSFTYRNRTVDVWVIARELGVRYILEGGVQIKDRDLRISARLVEASSGANIWSDSYNREILDVFSLQDDITRSVVASLHTQVQIAEGSPNSFPSSLERTETLPTWLKLNRAWSKVYQMTQGSLDEALSLANECVACQPDNSRAHQVLASALFHRAWMGFSKNDASDYNESLRAAERAVIHDPHNEYAHWILGLSSMTAYDHDRAIAALERSIQLNPNCSLAYGSLATVQNYAGLPDLAIINNKNAILSNPRDPSIFYRYTGLSLSYFLQNRFDLSINWGRQALAAKPSFLQAHFVMIAAFVENGMLKEASVAVRNLRAIYSPVDLGKLRRLPFRNIEVLDSFIASVERAF